MINSISTFANPSLYSLLTDIASRYKLRRGSGRYAGPCPKCGGSARSDKFVIQDDGGFKCYGCDFKGDIITWLREMEGKTCAEAHEQTGAPCRSTGCATRGTCRFGNGSGRRKAIRTRQPLRPPAKTSTLPIAEERNPEEIWQSWATGLVESGSTALLENFTILAYLASRGIDAQAVARFRLGFLGHDRRVNRADIGLADKNGKDKLWVPGGLLIPIFDSNGGVHRLRIRRTKEAMAKFLPDRKYVWLEGSGNSPLIITPSLPSRGSVIVEAELDAMAIAAAHDGVTVVALGTVRAGIPEGLRCDLAASPTILVALDADSGKDAAGPKAIKTWLNTFRQARYWPVPQAKDAGEYVALGGDLRQWIEVGLPPVITAPAAHDLAFCPDSCQPGVGGEESQQVEVNLEKQETVPPRVMTLIDGREVYITDNRDDWQRLTDAGKLVFSDGELARLKQSCSTMSDTERRTMVLLAVDIKETFSGAYIRGGSIIQPGESFELAANGRKE